VRPRWWTCTRLYRCFGADTPIKDFADGCLWAYFDDFKSYKVIREKTADKARSKAGTFGSSTSNGRPHNRRTAARGGWDGPHGYQHDQRDQSGNDIARATLYAGVVHLGNTNGDRSAR
jgi:hypothetical protein